MELFLYNIIIFSLCVISSYSFLEGKKIKKSIFSTLFMHNCFPILKQAMTTSNKGSWGIFKEHQSFSQQGGTMLDKHRSIKLGCFLLHWFHSPTREYFLHTAKCDRGTSKGTRKRRLSVLKEGKVLKPILSFLTPPIVPPNKLGEEGTVITATRQVQLNKVSCNSLKVNLFTISMDFGPMRKRGKTTQACIKTWIAALSPEGSRSWCGNLERKGLTLKISIFQSLYRVYCCLFSLDKNTKVCIAHVYMPCFFSFLLVLFHKLAGVRREVFGNLNFWRWTIIFANLFNLLSFPFSNGICLHVH